MAELKPCPFCGGAEIESESEVCFGGIHYRIFCSYCGSSTDLYSDKERAKNAWNERVEDDKS